MIVNCLVCGKEFKVKPGILRIGRGKCCSNKCSAELRKTGEYKKCKTCGKQFYLNSAELKDGKGRYCSDKCRYANTGKDCKCLNCGIVFYRTKTQLAQGGGKYCSQQCSNEGRKKRIKKICVGCTKVFNVQVHHANQAKYCSKKCQYPQIENFGYRVRTKTGFFRNCITCGKSIYVMPSRKDKKYCSMACMKAKLSLCANPRCSKEYYAHPSELKIGHSKYCSSLCRSEHLGTKLTVKCLNSSCDTLLQLYKSNLDNNIRRYCAKKCKPSRKTGEITKCRNCGKDFYVTPAQVGNRKNCNMKCYRTGELTSLHKKIRHLPIYFSWRTAVFERDNYVCRECGKKTKSLEAHHIKDFKTIKAQYNIQTIEDAIRCDELWDIDNGMTLCRQHHMETENHGARKRKKDVSSIMCSTLIPIDHAKRIEELSIISAP